MDFAAHERRADGSATYLKGTCKTCVTVLRREREGWGQRHWGYCKKGHKMRGDGKECLICARERHHRLRQNPERLERRREYRRIYQEAKRREEGVPRRNYKRAPGPRIYGPDVPIGPFQEWIEKHLERLSIREFCERSGMEERNLLRIRSGLDHGRVKTKVRLGEVDAALTAMDDNTFLWELYPSLYPDIESWAA